MSVLRIYPHSGLNRRLPEHKIVSDKAQKVRELTNLISLDGKIRIFNGASRYDSTILNGKSSWAKRIYYSDGGDDKRFQFSIINNKMYRGNDNNSTLNQVKVDDSMDTVFESNFYPTEAILKVAGTVSTFLVDGKYFYKFNGNDGGSWEKLPVKQDLDGNDIEPIAVAEYLDRMWVLTKKSNKLLGSKNLNPEAFDDATDSVLLEMSPGNGGFPVGFAKIRGMLYIVHEDYIVPLTGSSALTFGLRPGDTINGYGSRATRSILNLKNYFGFLNSTDGEYYLTAGTLDSTQKIPLSYEIKLGELINPTYAYKTVAHLDTLLNCIRISYPPYGDQNLKNEEIYSLTEEKWCGQTRGRNISCYSQWNGPGDDGRLITGRDDVGLLMVEDNSRNFDNTAIHYKLVTGSYIPDDMNDVFFETFYIDAKPIGSITLPVTYYLDARNSTSATEAFSMQGEGKVLGIGVPLQLAGQNVFINSATPYIDYSTGCMLRFEIEETRKDAEIELYGFIVNFNKLNAKNDKYIVGR